MHWDEPVELGSRGTEGVSRSGSPLECRAGYLRRGCEPDSLLAGAAVLVGERGCQGFHDGGYIEQTMQRFKRSFTLRSHAGLFRQTSHYGRTEVCWGLQERRVETTLRLGTRDLARASPG